MGSSWRKYGQAACGAAGLLCLALTNRGFHAIGGLFGPALGDVWDQRLVGAALLALGALAAALLWRERVDRRALWTMLLPVGAAMLVRACLLNYSSGDYENFLSQWVAYFRANGGFAAIADDLGDYNAPYLYFLAAISYLPVPDLYLIKLFSILADVLLAWGGFRLVRALRGRREGDILPLAAFALLLFLPTVVLNGAYWGQCDAIYGALTLHALALALEGRGVPSAALLGVAFSFKLQTVFLMPLWGVLWLARRTRFRELLAFPLAYVLTILPALLLGKPLADILGVYFGQMGEYSRLTLNAPSVFQFVPYGMEVDEALLSRLGILAAFGLVLVLLVLGFLLRDRLNNGTAMAMATALAIGVPFLLPHMHERYFFLADVVTVCWACYDRRRAPAAVLACGSSAASYAVYLRLKYNCVLDLFGFRFVMGLEALAMLAALLFTLAVLALDVVHCRKTHRERGEEP